MDIKFTKDFEESLEELLLINNSLSTKIEKIINDFKLYWFSFEIFQLYNLKKLNEFYFRLKIIPYRIIIKKELNIIVFDNIFKRKWKIDYKNYH